MWIPVEIPIQPIGRRGQSARKPPLPDEAGVRGATGGFDFAIEPAQLG